jgi:hypothetical protein
MEDGQPSLMGMGLFSQLGPNKISKILHRDDVLKSRAVDAQVAWLADRSDIM